VVKADSAGYTTAMLAQTQTSDAQYVTETYKYDFVNINLLRLALTAAHRSDRDGTKYDGYRPFAPLGVSALELVSAHSALILDVYTRRELSLARVSSLTHSIQALRHCAKAGSGTRPKEPM